MTVTSPTATPLPMQCCGDMGAAAATNVAGVAGGGAAADASTGAATGGGATTDLSTAIQQLQEAVTQLQNVVAQLQGVSGGGQSVVQANAGAGNIGGPVQQTAPPADATQTPPAAPAPAPAPAPTAPAADPAKFTGANITVKGVAANDEQKENIRLVLEKGKEMGVSDKVMTAAVETIIVESTAHNYEGGDRDSVGLFQQRDSWGSFDERHDPKTAAGKFYERAVNYSTEHPDVSTGNLSQKVQVSAFPDRYAEHEAEASAAVAAYKASVGA
ncbi:MAG: repeat superfamily protein [Thermoleophilia bacterium]|nr:repeat superfamily protein [Thermoleophilia bacterium]